MPTRMTEAQAQALAALITRLRDADNMPPWDNAGIISKLREAAPTASSFDLARAAINLAENRELRTPGLLPQPGPHWTKPDGSKPHRRGDHTMRCPEHGEPYLSCQPCRDTPVTPPPTDVRDEITAALEQAKEARARATAEQRDRNERKNQP